MIYRLPLAILLALLLGACDRSAPPKGSGTPPAPVKGATAPVPVPDPTTPTQPPTVPPTAETPLVCPTGLEEVVVVDAHDGDTITFEDGRRCRLIGLDTPELGRGAETPEPGALEARDRIRQLVIGRRARLEFEKDKEDDYHRLLAYVWIQDAAGKDLMVNETLLREGMGSVYPHSATKRYAEAFVRAQLAARRARAGIWREPWTGNAPYYVAYNQEVFHSSTCDGILKANKEKEIRFATLDEALDTGRAWCRNCRKKP